MRQPFEGQNQRTAVALATSQRIVADEHVRRILPDERKQKEKPSAPVLVRPFQLWIIKSAGCRFFFLDVVAAAEYGILANN